MRVFNLCIFIFIFIIHLTIETCDYKLIKLEKPGSGYDIVKDIPRNEVYRMTYCGCQMEEHNKYLIPDNYKYKREGSSHEAIDIFTTRNFTYYDGESSLTFTSDQSAQTFRVQIQASEVVKFKEYKSLMQSSDVVMTRMKFLHKISSLTVPVNNYFKDEFFKTIKEFVTAIKNKDDSKIQWIAYNIIKDYGTHVVESLTFGGSYVGIYFIKKDAVIATSYYSDFFKLMASFKIVAMSGKFAGEMNLIGECKENRMNFISKVTSSSRKLIIGGNNNIKEFDKWQPTVNNNRRVVEKRLQPMADVIRPLLENNDTIYKFVVSHLREAADKYYSKNIIKGCTDINAQNFERTATVDDETCKYDPNKCIVESCPIDIRNKLAIEFGLISCDSTRIFPPNIGVLLIGFTFYNTMNYIM